MQPSLELEEVQMTPRAEQPVMNGLCGSTTGRARQASAVAANLEIDPAVGGVELDVLDNPRRLQTQRIGKQRFQFNTHQTLPCSTPTWWTCGQAHGDLSSSIHYQRLLCMLVSTRNDEEPLEHGISEAVCDISHHF